MKETVFGLKIHTYGDPKDQAIVFLHGFLYDNTLWDAQIEAFSKDYYCIAYDLRGFGESLVHEGQFTIEAYVDDLKNLISYLNLEKPIICAMSMGGYIALRALERYKDMFLGMVLCDTLATSDTDEGKIGRANVIKNIDAKGLSVFAKAFIPKCFSSFYKKNTQHNIDKYIKKASKLDKVWVEGAVLAMAARTDTTKAAMNSKIPLLFICGEEDEITPPDMMRKLAQKTKSSKFILIANAAHMSMVENPHGVNRAMRDFLITLK